LRFFIFGSLRGQKRRARDIDLVVELDAGETVDEAMARVEEIGPRVRKPIELWLSRSESEPNLAGNYDHATGLHAPYTLRLIDVGTSRLLVVRR